MLNAGRLLGWATPALYRSIPGCYAPLPQAPPSGVRHGAVGASSAPQLRRIQKLGEGRTVPSVATQLSAGFCKPRSALLSSWTADRSPWPWSPGHLPRRFTVQPARSPGELLALDLSTHPQLGSVCLLCFSFAGAAYHSQEGVPFCCPAHPGPSSPLPPVVSASLSGMHRLETRDLAASHQQKWRRALGKLQAWPLASGPLGGSQGKHL